MARCPFFNHDVVPDPATLELGVGEVALCTVCSCFYRVKKAKPSYKLAPALAESALALAAIAIHGTAKARTAVAPYLQRKAVKDALRALQSP